MVLELFGMTTNPLVFTEFDDIVLPRGTQQTMDFDVFLNHAEPF